MPLSNPLGRWRSRTTFVFALAGSAVGLGNLWRFAYLVGDNGGAPFVITYIVCLFVLAVPVLIAEVAMGSHGSGSTLMAFYRAAERSRLGRAWSFWGVLACITGILILGYYIVIAGWGLHYAWAMHKEAFAGVGAGYVAEHFDGLLHNLPAMLAWQSGFLILALLIVGSGVRRGLGFFVWLLVPTMLVLLWLLIDFALAHGDVAAAGDFLFSLQWLDFTSQSVLVALGHAFYTLSVGVGIGVAFGAYAPRHVPVGRSVLAVAVFDTAVAMAAGVAIFPVVFAKHMEPTLGPGLLFLSVPYAFGNLDQGDIYGSLFFLLTALAALGSAVALLEPGVGSLVQHTRLCRVRATLLLGALVWLLGVAVAASLSDASVLAGFFPLLDRVTASFMLPLGALAVAVFVGWRLDEGLLRGEMYRESEGFFRVWLLLLRFVAPLAILVVWFWSITPDKT